MQSLTRDWNMAVIAALRLEAVHVGPTGGLALCVSYTSVSHAVGSCLALAEDRQLPIIGASGPDRGIGRVAYAR